MWWAQCIERDLECQTNSTEMLTPDVKFSRSRSIEKSRVKKLQENWIRESSLDLYDRASVDPPGVDQIPNNTQEDPSLRKPSKRSSSKLALQVVQAARMRIER